MDGNLCRCTGYRPIFDAFKSLANSDCFIQDIEDFRKCPRNKKETKTIGKIKSSVNGVEWYMPTTIDELMDVFGEIGYR